MKTWWRDVRLRWAFSIKLLVVELLSTRGLRGEKRAWLFAKYMLIDSLCRLASLAPAIFSRFIVAISRSNLDLSSSRAFLDSRSVLITACFVSSYCCKRVADKFYLVMLRCLAAYFFISTVFSSSICRRFIKRIFSSCIFLRSSSSIFARN